MKKEILNLGKVLNKKEQRSVSGGSGCTYDGQPCGFKYFCCYDPFIPEILVCKHGGDACHSGTPDPQE